MDGIPIDAPLAAFGDINRGKWPREFKPATGTIFSYAMNNYWDTNYRAGQSGDFTFRYVVTTSPSIDGEALTRLGLEEMRPSELNYVLVQDKVGNPPRPLPSAGTSFLETSAKNIALITWKPAENGNGTILRMVETGGQASEASVRFLRSNIASAHLCSGVEEDEKTLPAEGQTVRLLFRPFEVLTIRVSGR
jgi:alpha-mannosidase